MPVSQQSMTQQFIHVQYTIHNITRDLPDVVILSSVVEFQEVLDSWLCRQVSVSSSRRQLSRPWMTDPQGSHESISTRQSVDRLNVARSLYGADAGFHVRRLPHSDGLRRASIQSIDRSKFWSPSDLMRQSSLQSLKFITTLPPCRGVVTGSLFYVW